MYVLLDLETLSAFMEITYSVQVVLLFRFAERRNLPFSTSKAAKKGVELQNIPTQTINFHAANGKSLN